MFTFKNFMNEISLKKIYNNGKRYINFATYHYKVFIFFTHSSRKSQNIIYKSSFYCKNIFVERFIKYLNSSIKKIRKF